MKITYYGHSTFNVNINGVNVLFDPFISPNPLAREIDVDEIPADFILLSHGHEDHVADAEKIAKRTGAKLVSSYEVVTWFGGKGIDNSHPMNHGGKWDFDFGTVECTNAVHSSSMPDGANGGNPMGFHVRTAESNFYYAGDTALTMDMKLIGEYRKTDFAFLPLGDNFTMGVDDAVIAAEFVNCKKIIGMHYDTFGFIEIDKKAALEQFNNAGKELILLDIGGSMET